MNKRNELGQERRQYVRLDTVFPVQFRLFASDSKRFLSDWLQGFSSDIGKGGLCLTVNNLNPEFLKLIKEKQVKLSLSIELPIMIGQVSARAKVAWVKEGFSSPDKFLIGLAYEEIDPLQNNRIMRYAYAKKLFVPSVLSIIIVLGLFFGLSAFINAKLIKGNKALVSQLIRIAQESSIAKQKVKNISQEREDLQKKIQALELRIQTVGEERSGIKEKANIKLTSESRKTEELSKLIKQLTQEKELLQEKLIAIHQKENIVTEDLLRLDKRKTVLEKANFDSMYQWLRLHQNPRTGLVMSFEGDGDVEDWAFIYDQSLAAQAYTYFSNFEKAKKIFDFFEKKAGRQGGLFYNAYYVSDGSPAEYTVHSGPNVWLGIAIVQYTIRSRDKSYFYLTEEIAQEMINLQAQDKEGGLRGGPGLTWYSTEHNLDAYAFFNMLYKFTGKLPYSEAANKILKWLVANTYSKEDVPVKRGKGDSTIATDTYAWSIAAIGPEKLEELGMNPERIIEFAEKKCAVEVTYSRPEGQSVVIKGFDFAPQAHVARGGIVSSEWTAQMVIAFKKMVNFYNEKGLLAKSRAYGLKADEYLMGLVNMIISSPSPSGQGEGCIPYSTQDHVDTGHGWMTPKGKDTGSVAGTAYTLFAYYNYNPLELRD